MDEPYSVTRISNGKKCTFSSAGSDGYIRFYYEDESAIIFNVFQKTMYLVDCNNEIFFTGQPEQKYDLDLYQKAIDMYECMFSRQ